jgi:RNA-binding protein YhbY
MDPNEIKHLLIDVKRDPNRVQSADLKYPVILLSSGGEIKSILDGQHRIVKALENNEMIKVRILDLDLAPENFKRVFNI